MNKPDIFYISRIYLLLLFIIVQMSLSDVLAQSEVNAVQSNLEQNLRSSIKTDLSSFYPSASYGMKNVQTLSLTLFPEHTGPNMEYKPVFVKKNLQFSYGMSTDFAPAFSMYEYYKLKLDYSGIENLDLSLGGGLIKHMTIFDADYPDFHLGLNVSLSYSLNDLASVYAYGQYISPALNKNSAGYAVPQLLIHPVFLNSETGVGFRLKYKNIKSDFGLRTIYDTKYRNFKPVNTIGTKVKIGF
ncbi:hypothetical protein [Saccharicrinis sp. FJH54]|uniref:hypothetical protein n=1 Tax=Saccharicrinis sp. FJH54 TaxID=3344665 RepID=UPI0035D441B1